VSTRKATLRADKAAIKSAQDALTSQKLMDQTSTLQGQLNTYLQQKADATVKAPIGGTVTSVSAKAGEYPAMESPMFVIEDITHLKVEASVPEYDASLLDAGLGVHIVSDAIQDGEWDGSVESISPVASDANGNFTVTVAVTSDSGALKSGMSAKLNIVSDSRTNVFAVPYGALGKNANGESVIYVKQEADESSADGAGEAGVSVSVSVSGDANASGSAVGADRREVVVTTGLETDYYVEISGDGLVEGLLVLTDPEGLNTEEFIDPAVQFMSAS
jgi:RND family efflux transporter MFP subunit